VYSGPDGGHTRCQEGADRRGGRLSGKRAELDRGADRPEAAWPDEGPVLAVGDGALGFWAALRKVLPETREQRCWVHKTANALNKMPKSLQP